MGAIEDVLAGGGQPTSPPPDPPVVPATSVVKSVREHESWMRVTERFQKLRAQFQRGLDPLVADK